MQTAVTIETERIDDIALLVEQQRQMGMAQVIDEVIEGHGNRQGLSMGWMAVGWLSYILSAGDHRLSYVESWAGERLQVLQGVLSAAVSAQDFSDDRLGDLLHALSEDSSWERIEQRLGERLVAVYALPTERVHLDSTSAAVYHDPVGKTLFAYGHSKDHRPDLAQLKVMLGSLSPLALPLATLVVAGNVADDGLYLPVIGQVRQVLGRRGLLYTGDSKMEALAIRAAITAGGDFYLHPLSAKGTQASLLAELVAPVWQKQQALTDIVWTEPVSGEQVWIGEGYETTRLQAVVVAGERIEWQERLLVVYSPSLAHAAYTALMARLQRAEEQLVALTPARGRGKRPVNDLTALQTQADAIVQRQRVAGLLQVTFQRQVTTKQVRKYKARPARTEQTVRYQVQVVREQAAIQVAYRPLGWRLLATNTTSAQLDLAAAVLAYRTTPTHERGFSRLKNRPLGLRPLYLHREDHTIGLVRLLSLALRVLTLTEFVVRRTLHTTAETLAGLYEGNPLRTTAHPTTERLLRAFDNLTLTIVHLPERLIRHVTPLSPLQHQILTLLGFSSALYTQLSETIDFDSS